MPCKHIFTKGSACFSVPYLQLVLAVLGIKLAAKLAIHSFSVDVEKPWVLCFPSTVIPRLMLGFVSAPSTRYMSLALSTSLCLTPATDLVRALILACSSLLHMSDWVHFVVFVSCFIVSAARTSIFDCPLRKKRTRLRSW